MKSLVVTLYDSTYIRQDIKLIPKDLEGLSRALSESVGFIWISFLSMIWEGYKDSSILLNQGWSPPLRGMEDWKSHQIHKLWNFATAPNHEEKRYSSESKRFWKSTTQTFQIFWNEFNILSDGISVSGCGPPTSGSGRKFGRFHSKSCRENLTRLYLIILSAPKLHKLYGNLKFHNPYYTHD